MITVTQSLSLLLCIFLIVVNSQTNLDPIEYDNLLYLRTLFQLENEFPEPIDFCSKSIFFCVPPYIFQMSLVGNGTTVIPSFKKFTRLSNLQLKYVSDVNHFLVNQDQYLPHSVSSLTCENCNITQFGHLTGNIIGAKLVLINNPITGDIDLSNSSYNEFVLQNPHPLYSSFSQRYISAPLSNCTRLNFINTLSIIYNEPFSIECFNNIVTLSLQIGPNINQDIDFNSTINSLFPNIILQRTLKLMGSNLVSNNRYNFPNNVLVDELSLENINFKPNFVSMPTLRYFSAFDSLLSTDDGQLILNISLLQSFSTENIGIKVLPDLSQSKYLYFASIVNNPDLGTTFPSNLNSSKDYFLYLSNNSLVGPVDQSVCYVNVFFNDNRLTGELPSCLSCYLKTDYIKARVSGNLFSNYQNNDIYPPCNSVQITEFHGLRIGRFEISGVDLPYTMDSMSVNIPQTSLTYSNGTSINFLYPSASYNDVLKNYKDLVITIYTTSKNYTFSFPLVRASPLLAGFRPEQPYFNIGYFFTFVFADYLDTTTTVTMGNYQCGIFSKFEAGFKCSILDLNIPEKQYTFSITFQGIPTITFQHRFVRKFPILVAISTVPKTGGLANLLGSFGNNLTNSNIPEVTVQVGSSLCAIQSLSDQLLDCLLPPTQATGIQNITITTIGGLTGFFPNMFTYLEDGKPCLNNCGGNGYCQSVNGFCFCNIGWGGNDCSNRLIGGEVNHNGNITEISQDQVKFGLTIVGIQEISYDGGILKERLFDKWNQTTTNNQTTFSYSHLYENSTISYQIEEILKQRTIEFAGYNMSMDPGTFKLTANVSNWQFISSISSLKLLINTSMIVGDGCTDTEINSFGGETSLTHITIEKDGKIFYGRFIDRILSDGKPTFSSTKIINQTTTSILLGISLPHCSQCMLDPDFSILISNKQDNNCGETSSNRSWVIPTAVVVSIVGAAVLGTVAALIISRFYYIKFSKRQLIIIKKEKKKSGTDGEIKMR